MGHDALCQRAGIGHQAEIGDLDGHAAATARRPQRPAHLFGFFPVAAHQDQIGPQMDQLEGSRAPDARCPAGQNDGPPAQGFAGKRPAMFPQPVSQPGKTDQPRKDGLVHHAGCQGQTRQWPSTGEFPLQLLHRPAAAAAHQGRHQRREFTSPPICENNIGFVVDPGALTLRFEGDPVFRAEGCAGPLQNESPRRCHFRNPVIHRNRTTAKQEPQPELRAHLRQALRDLAGGQHAGIPPFDMGEIHQVVEGFGRGAGNIDGFFETQHWGFLLESVKS